MDPGRLTEAPCESFDPGDADATHLARIAIEERDTGAGDDVTDLILLIGFEVVVPEHSDNRDPHRRQCTRQHVGLIRAAVISQVARQEHQIGGLGDLCERGLDRRL